MDSDDKNDEDDTGYDDAVCHEDHDDDDEDDDLESAALELRCGGVLIGPPDVICEWCWCVCVTSPSLCERSMLHQTLKMNRVTLWLETKEQKSFRGERRRQPKIIHQ
jgi:hypothetical protein